MVKSLLAKAYFGPFRRPIRAVLSSLIPSDRILIGPARGVSLRGASLAHRLGIYELPVVHALVRLLRPGDVFFDIGAHIGYYCAVAERLGARVIAVEPMAECRFGHLERVAVGAAVGRCGLRPNDSQTAIAAGDDIPMTTVDVLAARHGKPHVIMVDVEGAEAAVLRGAVNTLASRPAWIIETHSAESHDAVKSILESAGYDVREIAPVVKRRASAQKHIFATPRGQCQVDRERHEVNVQQVRGSRGRFYVQNTSFARSGHTTAYATAKPTSEATRSGYLPGSSSSYDRTLCASFRERLTEADGGARHTRTSIRHTVLIS